MGNDADLQATKARLKATWEAGDFGQVAKYIEPVAAEFMAELPLRAGVRLLDVACGTGNLAVIAAGKGCETAGVDIAANLLAQARERAKAEGLAIDYREGDAEALPYADRSFDVTVSMFGVMFAPRPELAAMELLRVTRPGGTIALANWTPEGFIGKMFKVFVRHSPPPAGAVSPLLWGTEEVAQERLRGAAKVDFRRRMARMHYPFDVPATVEFFRKYYGPTQRLFAALSPAAQAALRSDLEVLQAEWNTSDTPGETETRAEYLEVIAVR